MWKAVSTMIVAISFSVMGNLRRFGLPRTKPERESPNSMTKDGNCESGFAQRRKGYAKTQRRLNKKASKERIQERQLSLSSSHHQTDLFFAYGFWIYFAYETTAVYDHYPIAQAQHF